VSKDVTKATKNFKKTEKQLLQLQHYWVIGVNVGEMPHFFEKFTKNPRIPLIFKILLQYIRKLGVLENFFFAAIARMAIVYHFLNASNLRNR
jgi:hypothetical protein